MKRYLHSRLTALGFVAATILSVCAANAATPYSRMFVFGDSLSDSGNVFVLTRALAMAPYDPIPDRPYAIGAHHFSNGATWVEQLAVELQAATSAQPAMQQRGIFGNYAFGGARARLDGLVPGLDSQADLFAADFAAGAPSDALYVIFIGGNDVRDALQAFAIDGTGVTSTMIINEALTALGATLQRLWLAGARHFLVATVPDIGATPAVRALGPGAQFLARLFSTMFNASLEANVLGPADALPGVEITRFDVFTVLDEVVSAPALSAFADVTTPCLQFFVLEAAVCQNRDDHLFWDAVHPTRAGHRVLATAAAAALTLP